LSRSGESYGYGSKIALVASTPPRRRLSRSEPGPPRTGAPDCARGGDPDGRRASTLVNTNTQAGVDALNARLFPLRRAHTPSRCVISARRRPARTLAAGILTSTPGAERQTCPRRRQVGYLPLQRPHPPGAAADRRHHAAEGAGVTTGDRHPLQRRCYLDIASELAYMVAGPGPTPARVQQLNFNDKNPFG